jgi:hypothetical protein
MVARDPPLHLTKNFLQTYFFDFENHGFHERNGFQPSLKCFEGKVALLKNRWKPIVGQQGIWLPVVTTSIFCPNLLQGNSMVTHVTF